jgi:4-hydroxy-3-polyprenylbenzoate decarboxylase
MTTLTEAGAIIFPASPSFYFGTTTIEELCMELSRRIVGMLGVEVAHRQWGE